ncbi:Transposase DDE domain group 1, partial [Nannocystis exedens]
QRLFVDTFLAAHDRPPAEIVLDLDATDDPVHGKQEGRFFHGFYDSYCYLPLYVFCGDFILGAALNTADKQPVSGAVEELERIVSQILARSTAEGLVIPLPEDGLLERAVSGADVARASSSLATERSSRRRYRSTCRSLRLVRMLAARPK